MAKHIVGNRFYLPFNFLNHQPIINRKKAQKRICCNYSNINKTFLKKPLTIAICKKNIKRSIRSKAIYKAKHYRRL